MKLKKSQGIIKIIIQIFCLPNYSTKHWDSSLRKYESLWHQGVVILNNFLQKRKINKNHYNKA